MIKINKENLISIVSSSLLSLCPSSNVSLASVLARDRRHQCEESMDGLNNFKVAVQQPNVKRLGGISS